jgi:hypothetical protein
MEERRRRVVLWRRDGGIDEVRRRWGLGEASGKGAGPGRRVPHLWPEVQRPLDRRRGANPMASGSRPERRRDPTVAPQRIEARRRTSVRRSEFRGLPRDWHEAVGLRVSPVPATRRRRCEAAQGAPGNWTCDQRCRTRKRRPRAADTGGARSAFRLTQERTNAVPVLSARSVPLTTCTFLRWGAAWALQHAMHPARIASGRRAGERPRK